MDVQRIFLGLFVIASAAFLTLPQDESVVGETTQRLLRRGGDCVDANGRRCLGCGGKDATIRPLLTPLPTPAPPTTAPEPTPAPTPAPTPVPNDDFFPDEEDKHRHF